MIKEKQKYIEKFFISMMEAKFNNPVSYLEMPNNNSFNFFIKEILYCLRRKEKTERIRDFTTQIYTNFYQFMLKDRIFKEVNDFEYRNLMIRLKNYSENKALDSEIEQKAYFERLNKRYSKEYRTKCYESLLTIYSNTEDVNEEKLYNISLTFINEILARKINYQFFSFILRRYEMNKFENFTKFIKYLHYHNIDNVEIYLPIKNETEKDIKFLKDNGQEVLFQGEEKYCKTYQVNMIDFFTLVERQVIRIEAIFNTLRFYTSSEIDFDLDKNIIVHSSYFNENIELRLRDVMSYANKTLSYKNQKNMLSALNKLKGDDVDDYEDDGVKEFNETSKKSTKKAKRNIIINDDRKSLYYKILNILSFAEKDKDLLNHNSFVDNWTALETLCSLSKIKKGYEAVKYIVPKVIATRVILNDINDVFYKESESKSITHKAQAFINECINKSVEYSIIKNPYFEFKLKKYEKIFSSLQNFEKYIKKIESVIEYDLMRIYIIRNEYAHESNLNVFNSMQQYKLKTILPLIIDEFFRIMNSNIDHEETSEGLAFDVFSDLLLRYKMRENLFLLINKGMKLDNGGIDLKIKIEEETKINEADLMFNIIKNNNDLMRKYL